MTAKRLGQRTKKIAARIVCAALPKGPIARVLSYFATECPSSQIVRSDRLLRRYVKEGEAMQRLSLVLAAAAFVFAANAQAADQGSTSKPPNPCKAHATQADCSADQACSWNTTKNKCKMATH